MNSDWYSEGEGKFFGPSYLEAYDLILTPERTMREVDFVESVFDLKNNPEVKMLDIPCGHGRHAIELARRGYKVTGQDLNGYFLEVARKKAKEDKVDINFIQGDMREINFENEFDYAINLFTAFGYLESKSEDQKHLDAVYKTLKLDGKLILEVRNRDWALRNYEVESSHVDKNGVIYIEEREFEIETSRNHSRVYVLYPDGTRKDFGGWTSLRFYTATELIEMFETAGFEVLKIYGDYDQSELTMDSKRCILLGQKISGR